MITDLPTKRIYLSDITVTNISESFTCKMASKINWHRYETIIASPPYVYVFPYSLPSVGPGADPGVQAVSPQVT